jgi:hypothetical protein
VKKILILGLGLSLILVSSMLLAVASSTCNPVPHEPILITSDSDLANSAVSGHGTANDPYLIGNWQINNLTPGYAIKVDNSKGKITNFFQIRCIQSNFEQLLSAGTKFIWIVNVHTPTTVSDVQGNSLDAPGVLGVQLDSSSNITLDSLSLNRIGSDGVLLNSSDHINIIHSKLKSDGAGLRIVNSNNISIGSPCHLATGTNCNEFTYDDKRGIWINNSHDIIAQYTITSADDGGGIVVDGKDSHNVTLVNGTASGNGPICRINQSTGTREPTGPKIDFISGIAIINGAYNINVKDYTIQGDGHYDIMNGGDGIYINRCTGNNTNITPITLPGGANLNLNGNCYSTQYGFNPAPTKSCPRS